MVLITFVLAWAGSSGFLWAAPRTRANLETQTCVAAEPSLSELFETLQSWEELKKQKPLPEVELPPVLHPISIRKEDATQDFELAVARLRKTWTPEAIRDVREITRLGIEGAELTPEQRKAFNTRLKEIRSDFKSLRFLYEALSERHKLPDELDELTIAIGKLRDVIQGKRGDPKDLVRYSKRLSRALEPSSLKKVETEIARFAPADKKSFEDWMRRELKATRKILKDGKARPDTFHDVRKSLQAILTVYQHELALHPGPGHEEWDTVTRFLLRETEQLGEEHESWERGDVQNKMDYDKDNVKLPKELRKKLLDFIESLEDSFKT
jgi:CHAD domain-containing protein